MARNYDISCYGDRGTPRQRHGVMLRSGHDTTETWGDVEVGSRHDRDVGWRVGRVTSRQTHGVMLRSGDATTETWGDVEVG